MKTEDILLYGAVVVGSYLLFSKTALAAAPATRTAATPAGSASSSKPAGSSGSGGGPSGGGSGGGGSSGGGYSGAPGPGSKDFVGPVDLQPGQSVTNSDGTITTVDASGNLSVYDPYSGVTYDGTGNVIDLGAPLTYVDTFDPCDPNSSVYDFNQCGSAADILPPDIPPPDPTAGGL